jgi:hypothetical protein
MDTRPTIITMLSRRCNAMKRMATVVLSIPIALVFIAGLASADVEFTLGIKGGASLVKADYSWEGDPPSRVARPVFGAFVSIDLGSWLAFQPELFFVTKGGKWIQDPEGRYEIIAKLTTIHLPMLLKVRPARIGRVVPVLFAGPALDLILSARHGYYEDGELIEADYYSFILKKTAVDFVFGGGVDVEMDKLKLIFDVRYDLGLANLVRGDPGQTYKTNALMILAGIGF